MYWLTIGYWALFFVFVIWMQRDSRHWWAQLTKLQQQYDELEEKLKDKNKI